MDVDVVKRKTRKISIYIVIGLLGIVAMCYICFFQFNFRLRFNSYNFYTNCTMNDCFLKSRCKMSSKFKAFVYPNKTGEKPFKNLLYGKEYFTDDTNEACVFVYFLDEDVENLPKLKYWGKNGENHIIINLDNRDIKPFNNGFALLAQSSFSSQNFRPGFDFLSPLYNEKLSQRIWESLTPIFPLKRKWLLSYMESYDSPLKNADIFQENKEKLCRLMKVWKKVSSKLPGNIVYRCSSGLSNSRPTPKENQHRILNESIFTVILVPPNAQTSLTFQHLLFSALYSGTIPVLIGPRNKKENLPLQEYVPWDKIVVWLPSFKIKNILSSIRTFGEADINQMKQDGRYAVEILLSQKGSILSCILETIIKRLYLPGIGFQPTPSKKLFVRYPKNFKERDYHQPAAYNYGQQFLAKMTIPSQTLSFIDPRLGLGRSWPVEKFTIVMLTFHRERILNFILTQYKNMPFLDRIVLVWNAQDRTLKNESLIPDIGVPIYVVTTGQNNLNNRFLPFDIIRTQAVFTLDDDLSFELGDILLAFRVWRENRDRIVGFPARVHRWDDKKRMWVYGGRYPVGQSLILTGASFLHKHYFYMYTYVMNSEIRDRIYEIKNCEDIAMNMLVAHISRKAPIKVVRNPFLSKVHAWGLSFVAHHIEKRNKCLNDLPKIYGYVPLINTQFEADYQLPKESYNHHFRNII